MPTVTFDGRSFMLDGRRIWLVSGSIQYARIPRGQWADRIHAAKLAGLNTVQVPVIWSRHEPMPGTFEFKGENDLRHFIELIGQAGLYCILRPGPYVDTDWDLGGLPPWLLQQADMRLRTNSGPFLEAASRYITAVARQVRDLQIMGAGNRGPILMVENEHRWTCGDDTLAGEYLGELQRYLREAGIVVPTITTNNLWTHVEGPIDSWCGAEQMLATVRQLSAVHPDRPRIVAELAVGQRVCWGEGLRPASSPAAVQRQLGEVLAGAGQFNIWPFHGGTSFGFDAGQAEGEGAGFVATRSVEGAPLDEPGGPGESFAMVRRICSFASSFSRLLSNLDPEFAPAAVDPSYRPGAGKKRAAKNAGVSIVHASGSQGEVVFVFGDEGATKQQTSVLLSDGTTLPVALGDQSVAWCVLNHHLVARQRLDYTNLNCWALAGRMLVVYGPAGHAGVVSINGTPMSVDVPRGKTPTVVELEGVTVVVLSESMVDRAYLHDETLYVGADGLRADGTPIGAGNATAVSQDGTTSSVALTDSDEGKAAPKISVGAWEASPAGDYVDGTSARYASIPGPAPLGSLGSSRGYGWYRLTFRSTSAKRVKLMLPQAGDRVHVFLDSEHQALLGSGPGAAGDSVTLSLKKGEHSLVLLAENLGRPAGGVDMSRPKGVWGHLWETTPVRTGRASVETEPPIDLLGYRSPLWEVHRGDTTEPDRLTWTFTHRKKTPVFFAVDSFIGRGLVVVNGTPVRMLTHGERVRLVLDTDVTGRGNCTVQIAPIASFHDDGTEIGVKDNLTNVSLLEAKNCFSAKASWAFANWEPPPPASFVELSKSAMVALKGPSWWRIEFTPAETDAPLFFDTAGLTKGQVYLNGTHVGRYFTSLPGGKQVGPQTRLLLPEPWLEPGNVNELMVFDEHGGNPSRSKFVYEPKQRPIKA